VPPLPAKGDRRGEIEIEDEFLASYSGSYSYYCGQLNEPDIVVATSGVLIERLFWLMPGLFRIPEVKLHVESK